MSWRPTRIVFAISAWFAAMAIVRRVGVVTLILVLRAHRSE